MRRPTRRRAVPSRGCCAATSPPLRARRSRCGSWEPSTGGGSGGGAPQARSPVRLVDAFEGALPPLDVAVRVAERRGCDRSPIDPASKEGQLTLLSYVWGDQLDRIELLRGALAVARATPLVIDQARAASW